MVPFRHVLAFSAIALLAVVRTRADDAKLFFGEIPIQSVGPGEKIALDLHRFLHPPEASVRVDGTDVSFDAKAFTLSAKANATGLSRWQITAELKGHKIVRMLVLAVEPSLSTRITFKPVRPAQKVMIAGPFNGWKQNATPMNGPDVSGVYQIDIAFPAGRQPYKFIVDGEWTLDPVNSATDDNGQGGKNSVLTVENKTRDRPTIYADRRAANKIEIRAVSANQPITTAFAIIQAKSGDTFVEAKIESDEIEVPVASDTDSIRVIANSRSGAPTNTVYCNSRQGPQASGSVEPTARREPAPPEGKQFDWRDAILYMP